MTCGFVMGTHHPCNRGFQWRMQKCLVTHKHTHTNLHFLHFIKPLQLASLLPTLPLNSWQHWAELLTITLNIILFVCFCKPIYTKANGTDGPALIAFPSHPLQKVGAVSAHSDPVGLGRLARKAQPLSRQLVNMLSHWEEQGWHWQAFQRAPSPIAAPGERRTRVGEPLNNSFHREIQG